MLRSKLVKWMIIGAVSLSGAGAPQGNAGAYVAEEPTTVISVSYEEEQETVLPGMSRAESSEIEEVISLGMEY